MSYIKTVYSERSENYPMESVLFSPLRELFSGLFLFIGILGTMANLLILYVYYEFYTSWLFTTKLWINMSLCMLFNSAVIVIRAIGDNVEGMGDSPTACSLRMYIPAALDITCLGCLLVMFFDRLTVVHFPNLYIYNEKNNNCKIMYGWLYGLTFFFFKMYVIEQENLPDRCLTAVSMAFPLESVSLVTYAGAFCFLCVGIQGYVFTPSVNTHLQREWIHREVDETVRVLALGGGIILLWLPKHFLTLMYLTAGWPEFEYQILLMLLHIPGRLAPTLPLLVLLHKEDFGRCFLIVLNLKDDDKSSTKHSIASEQAHVDSVFRSVIIGMFPNHPELIKMSKYVAHMPQQGTVSETSNPHLKKTGTNSVTFDDDDVKKVTPVSGI